MKDILKKPYESLGYHFIPEKYLPEGKDEYYLRNIQNTNGIKYRHLTAYEIEVLVRNRNTSDNWNNILVSDYFQPEQVQDCKFFGLVRIGKLEPVFLEFHNLRRPVGLYNSTIISCDFGDNVVVDNVNYISHYIIGNEVILVNINELTTTDYAKFGSGLLKDGEEEEVRIWMELCNENGGRKVIPFHGMLPGDAYLWTRNRHSKKLQEKFKEFHTRLSKTERGYYGMIGDRTVIKNCRILKDVIIGEEAYLKGANKIKNVTIESNPEGRSQIGEGCELVNGIIEEGCRIFYGVKAVRFYLASHSQLKYGARLINSYLGNNSTISCCEVLNSLIFPFHEQHHNNSFLCASLLMGQSNMAAGATIGSNHNSRSADGEIIAGRGFWPGLCVSLKHNSKFAGFCIIAKGDYPYEMNIRLPFSLIRNDASSNRLMVMPGYWFIYNMYALARNAWKYSDRDHRVIKKQHIEYHYLAPDSVNEMINGLRLLEEYTGNAYLKNHKQGVEFTQRRSIRIGKQLLEEFDPIVDELEITIPDAENSNRKCVVLKTREAYHSYLKMIHLYCFEQITEFWENTGLNSYTRFKNKLPDYGKIEEWSNVGGQLVPTEDLNKLLKDITSGKINSWDDIHNFYVYQADKYPEEKLRHALSVLKNIIGIDLKKAGKDVFEQILEDGLKIKAEVVENIYRSRAKDYTNPFRASVYENREEMEVVTGSLEHNEFILMEKKKLEQCKRRVRKILNGL